mgnify:CR=1 FL=1
MSSFLPHKTFVNNESTISKVSLSRRIDDLSSTEWGERKFVNAYNNSIDRDYNGAINICLRTFGNI